MPTLINWRWSVLLIITVEYFTVHGLVVSEAALEGQWSLIREFLDNPEANVICALWDKGHSTIQFHQRIPNTEEECLLFYKIPQINKSSTAASKLSPEASTQLGLLTLEGGFIKSIYNSVSRVFSPQAAVQVSKLSFEFIRTLPGYPGYHFEVTGLMTRVWQETG